MRNFGSRKWSGIGEKDDKKKRAINRPHNNIQISIRSDKPVEREFPCWEKNKRLLLLRWPCREEIERERERKRESEKERKREREKKKREGLRQTDRQTEKEREKEREREREKERKRERERKR